MKTKTKLLKVSEEFQVGKHGIGYLYNFTSERLGTDTFTPRTLGTFQKLPRTMTDKEIEAELKPGLCELGDVLAFLDKSPEECKDGYANLFYLGSCVVGVLWCAARREWNVGAWRRGDLAWPAGPRVFSPATGSQKLESPQSLESFVTRSEFEAFKSQVEKVLKLGDNKE